MAKNIVMPKLGLTMVDGKVSKWNISEGDSFAKGDVLYEVETDKLTYKVEADVEGTLLKIVVDQGSTANVGAVVAVVGKEGETVVLEDLPVEGAAQPKPEEVKKNVEKAVQIMKGDTKDIIATPYAKKLARERNIDLTGLQGSGLHNMVVASDLDHIAATAGRGRKTTPVAAKMMDEFHVNAEDVPGDHRITKKDVLSLFHSQPATELTETIEADGMRRTIAHRMKESWDISPRVTYQMEVDFGQIIQLRNSLKPKFEQLGLKLTYNHILMKIVSKALMEHPYLNGQYHDDQITLQHFVNLGMAVDVPGGLLVPNVKNAHDMNLVELSVNLEELIENSKSGNLTEEDLTGGTFTITNIGMFGIDAFSPIINQPEVAILGVNRIVEKPIVKDGEIVIGHMLNLSLTADHRLVDGATAARFMKDLRTYIENPFTLLI